jgi:subtilisin family serine protease
MNRTNKSRHVPLLGVWLLAALSSMLLAVAQTSAQKPKSTPAIDGHPVVPGEVLVRFRSEPTAADLAVLREQLDADHDQEVGTIGVRRFHSRSINENALLAFLRSHPAVAYAEPNYVLTATQLPSDPYFSQLWAMQNTAQAGADIGAVAAWDVSTGAPSIVVGVIDTGIDYTHQDLAPNVWSAPATFTVTVGGVKVTCAAGTHGFNALTMACDPMDDNNHGTHVSGTIGAAGNNGVGVVGVNWTSSIIGAKFLNSSGSGSTADAVNAIDFVIKTKQAFASTNGANVRVLSNSWGGGGFSQALLDEVKLANSNGILFVAAAGNNGSNNSTTPFYPASYNAPNVVAVAATDYTDHLASFSNYGSSSVHLGAPGVGIISTTIGNTYSNFSGTSMATPHVAGAAALILSHCGLDTAGVKNTLMSSVDILPSLLGYTISGGRLNVNTAIRNCAAAPSVAPAAPNGLTSTASDAQVTLAWQASAGASAYSVKRSTISGVETTVASGLTTTSYLDTAVTNGVTYFYVVSAVNATGESPNSNETGATPFAPATTAPDAPANLAAATGPGVKKITLTWKASSGAVSYSVLRSTASGGPYAVVRAGLASPTFTNSGLSGKQQYFYVVTATNAGGTSGYSNEASATAK